MFPQSCMNTKDGAESLRILNTAASHGERGTPRLVFLLNYVPIRAIESWSARPAFVRNRIN